MYVQTSINALLHVTLSEQHQPEILMIALSIRQPWASLILKAHKDIENRCWPTKVRGRILIHAAKGMTWNEYEDAIAFAVDAIRADARDAAATRRVTLRELGFAFSDLQRGGIIGSVEIVDCVRHSNSPWFSVAPKLWSSGAF